MRQLRRPLWLSLLAVLLTAVPQARAEPIPWNYSGSVVTTGPSSTLGTHFLADGVTWVQFADVTGTGTGSDNTHPGGVTAFQIRTFPNAAFHGFSPGFYQQNVHTFDLTVGLTDTASGKSGSLTFHGGVNGFVNEVSDGLGGGVAWSQLKLTFSNPSSQALMLGNHLYKVSIDPYTFTNVVNWPPPPNASTTPSAYQNVPMHVQVSDVPEPSTLALLATGLAGLGLRAWRRRRASRELRPAA